MESKQKHVDDHWDQGISKGVIHVCVHVQKKRNVFFQRHIMTIRENDIYKPT